VGGALKLALLIRFWLALNIDDVSATRPVILIAIVSVVASLLAYRYGNKFWFAVMIFFGSP
jgi:hypothetical protein